MAQMEAEAAVGEVSPETDRLFHDVLYRPLGNPLVGQLLGAFWDVYHRLRDDLGGPDETPADVARRHRDIYAAVTAGDRDAAVAAMRAHFDGVRARPDPVADPRLPNSSGSSSLARGRSASARPGSAAV